MAKTEYLSTIEFRYTKISEFEHGGSSKSETITIGVFSDFNEACLESNKILVNFETIFKLNPNWNKKERFSKNGGCFGTPKTLITNLAYLQTPFEFYFKITKLDYTDVDHKLLTIVNSIEEYRNSKTKE